MHSKLEKMNLRKPLGDLFPFTFTATENLEFNNLTHFISTVSQLKQLEDDKCGISYEKAIKELRAKKPQIEKTEQESIRNLVRANLQKRGLITEEVYEAYRYTSDGTTIGVDVGKYAAGEPDCVISPARQYVDFFHELFINISYPWQIDNEEVLRNSAKLLATIEELERQHILIKITLVFPCRNPAEDKNLFLSIPLFSHKEFKSIDIMSAVLNDRLLRKFCFALLEDVYGKDLNPGYGSPSSLDNTMNIGYSFSEIAFFEEIVEKVGA